MQGTGFRVQGAGYRGGGEHTPHARRRRHARRVLQVVAPCRGCRVEGTGFVARYGLQFMVQGTGYWALGLGFRVQGLGFGFRI